MRPCAQARCCSIPWPSSSHRLREAEEQEEQIEYDAINAINAMCVPMDSTPIMVKRLAKRLLKLVKRLGHCHFPQIFTDLHRSSQIFTDLHRSLTSSQIFRYLQHLRLTRTLVSEGSWSSKVSKPGTRNCTDCWPLETLETPGPEINN